MAGESYWSLCYIILKHRRSVLLREGNLVSVCSGTQLLYNGKDSSYSKHWQQGPAMGWLTYFWNEWEWQQVLPAFHFSFHTPWLNGKCWTKTAAMFPGSLVGYVQHFSVSLPEYRISSLFICHALYLWFFIPYFHFPLFLSRCLTMSFFLSPKFFLFTLFQSILHPLYWVAPVILCILCQVKQLTI